MRTITVIIVCIAMLSIAGCGAQKEASASAAIDKTQTMSTIQQKVDYLAGQAKAFVNSKQYDQAVATAQYILANLDRNSQEAVSLLQKAKDGLAAQAKAKLDEAKKQFGL
jgi:hypothetical protein